MEGMAGYFPLAEQFHTQAEPAFCGLGTYLIVIAVRVPIPSTENVVLGGLFTSTALTLVVLPALYAKFGKFLLAKANQLVRENGKVVQASFER